MALQNFPVRYRISSTDWKSAPKANKSAYPYRSTETAATDCSQWQPEHSTNTYNSKSSGYEPIGLKLYGNPPNASSVVNGYESVTPNISVSKASSDRVVYAKQRYIHTNAAHTMDVKSKPLTAVSNNGQNTSSPNNSNANIITDIDNVQTEQHACCSSDIDVSQHLSQECAEILKRFEA